MSVKELIPEAWLLHLEKESGFDRNKEKIIRR